MKSHFSRLEQKTIHYCKFKKFEKQKFLPDIKTTGFSVEKYNPNESYSALINNFYLIVAKHSPLKENRKKEPCSFLIYTKS